MVEVAKAAAPHHLITYSFITWDPKDDNEFYRPNLGMDADTAYRMKGFDMALPHAYYFHIRDPRDTWTGPGEMLRGIQYGFYQIRDMRPILDGESGPSPLYITSFRDDFTQEDDEAYFTRNLWAHFVAGGAGSPIRWPGEMYPDTNTITGTMRSRLGIFHSIIGHMEWDGTRMKIRTAMTDNGLTAGTRTDGTQFVTYIMNPGNTSIQEIPLNASAGIYTLEFYSPLTGELLGTSNNTLLHSYGLPEGLSWTKDMVVVGKRRPFHIYVESPQVPNGESVTVWVDVYPFEKRDVYMWITGNGATAYLKDPAFSELSPQRTPLLRRLSFDGVVTHVPLVSIPPLAPGQYKFGLALDDLEEEVSFEVLPTTQIMP